MNDLVFWSMIFIIGMSLCYCGVKGIIRAAEAEDAPTNKRARSFAKACVVIFVVGWSAIFVALANVY